MVHFYILQLPQHPPLQAGLHQSTGCIQVHGLGFMAACLFQRQLAVQLSLLLTLTWWVPRHR